MGAKPEARYIQSVNRLLPEEVHHEGMGSPWVGGRPDQWYDGPSADLWVEYKYTPRIPPAMDLLNQNQDACLSPLQRRWLRRAYRNGRNVAVIVGSPEGGVILRDLEWETVMMRDIFLQRALPKKEIAEWIKNQVALPPATTSLPCSRKMPATFQASSTASTKSSRGSGKARASSAKALTG